MAIEPEAHNIQTINTQQVLKELGISRPTLYKWMERGLIRPANFNPFFEKQSKLLFLKSDVESLKERIRQSNSAA